MAKQTVTKTEMTHKNPDPNKPRRKLTRTKLKQNGKKIDLSKIAARRTLVVRR